MNKIELKQMLDDHHDLYNCKDFIELDPISIPHKFETKEDREISGFLAATIAWGQRKMILRNSNLLMKLMNNQPYHFISTFRDEDLERFEDFKHRTFNYDDLLFFLNALRYIYTEKGGLEQVFTEGYKKTSTIKGAIIHFREVFLSVDHLERSEKHIANPMKGSAAKRINMFLRWMVRKDDRGVDFGLWKNISSSDLMCPLDVHSSRVARQYGLLQSKQDNWKSVEELTNNLSMFNADDPVRYDFALFGTGESISSKKR
ncbi:MAG: TIGR02757 family protein [Hyphomicrobiales bacterium]